MTLESIIGETLSGRGEYVFGFADITGLLNNLYRDYRGAISIGKKLDDDIIDPIAEGPTREYYHHYHQVNRELAEVLAELSNKLQAHHIDHTIIRPTVSSEELTDEHYKTLTHDFSHKMAATRAGLGWIGKTDLLISKSFGPRLRLASILIKSALPVTSKACTESRCGSCSICVDACPAHAATGALWNTAMKRDNFFNAFKCMDKCRELANRQINKNESICGICISVCPLGKHHERG